MSNATPPPAGQVWDAGRYMSDASFVPALGAEVFDLLAPQPGERILDLGCGDGILTRRLAAAGAAVTGLEPDPELAAAARARDLEILEQDAHDAFGTCAFEAVFSNAALHWMRDPETVIANAFGALHPGGRFVAEQGGFGNVAAIRVALEAALGAAGHPLPACPWDFPTAQEQAERLERAGFHLKDIKLFARPTPLPSGFDGWLRTFAGPYLADLPPEAGDAIRADTARRLHVLRDSHGTAIADYVRLRFVATRP